MSISSTYEKDSMLFHDIVQDGEDSKYNGPQSPILTGCLSSFHFFKLFKVYLLHCLCPEEEQRIAHQLPLLYIPSYQI